MRESHEQALFRAALGDRPDLKVDVIDTHCSWCDGRTDAVLDFHGWRLCLDCSRFVFAVLGRFIPYRRKKASP